MGNKLEGKVAVITGGGSSGIGLATAKRFVSVGACVFIIDLHKEELDSALSEIGSKNVVWVLRATYQISGILINCTTS
jgi:NAD(P)-dependent dehydrogenase (short-subunit alcohol dehydrogenase family)